MKAALYFVTGMVFGVAATVFYQSHLFRQHSTEIVCEASISRVIEHLNTLTLLESNEVDRLRIENEEKLSSEVHVYSLTCERPRQTHVRVLSAVARYRARNPYNTGNEDLDVAVRKALADVETGAAIK